MSYIILDGSAFTDPVTALDAWQTGAVLHTLSDKAPFTIVDSEVLHRRRFVYIRMADGTHARIPSPWEGSIVVKTSQNDI
jgi:hypothetical protein